ncbi:MAG: hypothetical protein IH851_07915 [Armatimonadetes bacterium]|nr:hypothetical protein [Armatimonadota bacterium]
MARLPKWFWLLAIAALALSSLPYVYGWARTPEGSTYLGVHTNFDDHAVYAAWMKQAQEGRFFFENRFTTDEQPRLTVHLYFFTLGNLSRVTGIPLAMHIGRLLFGLLFLVQLYRLVCRATESDFVRRVAVSVAVFGAGTGWLYWARYGHNGPIDVWQPEAFVFPSLMTNGLFCVSLWLILVVWNSILDAKESWKPVLAGAAAMLVLTNIHTYDALTIAIVAVGLLISQAAAGQATIGWIGRAAVIAVGALPPALWFIYVRANDPVFAARADTPTFSPPFFDVLAGFGPLLLLALAATWVFRRGSGAGEPSGRGAAAAVGVLALFTGIMLSQSGYTASALWVQAPAWLLLFLVGGFFCYLLRPANPAYGLLFSWMVLGIIAVYYPGLFQRKLTMGLQLPIGILAGLSIGWALERVDRGGLRRASALAIVFILSLTSLRWIQREVQMAQENLSNTTVHTIYLDEDVAAILRYLRKNAEPGEVLLAMPGVPARTGPDSFALLIPDLNPVITGWAGLKTWAGHWSETPGYSERRAELMDAVYSSTSNPETFRTIVGMTGARFVIIPVSETAAQLGVPHALAWVFEPGMTPVYAGESFTLLEVRRPPNTVVLAR